MNSTQKERIIEILTESFRENKSTNFVIKQDRHKELRLRRLIEYSIFQGEQFGEVFLSDDGDSCYIVLDSSKKKTTLKGIRWDLRFIFQCIGIKNLQKVLKREYQIKLNHPKEDFIHLWYIGVIPAKQGNGKGTGLMQKIIRDAHIQNKKIYLETSTEKNFDFYLKLGFHEVTTITKSGYSLKIFTL